MSDLDGPQPQPLTYEPQARQAGPRSGQVLLGFLAWIATLIMTSLFGAVGHVAAPTPVVGRVLGVAVTSVPIVGVLFLGSWLRLRHGWRGFLPGLLLGFSLTCLLPYGLVEILGRVRWSGLP